MKQKGQALVEFIIILPIFLLLLYGALDLGNILLKKYQLESDMDTIVYLYQQNKKEEIVQYSKTHQLEVFYHEEGVYTTIILYKQVSVATPGLNLLLSNPYTIEIERVVYHE